MSCMTRRRSGLSLAVSAGSGPVCLRLCHRCPPPGSSRSHASSRMVSPREKTSAALLQWFCSSSSGAMYLESPAGAPEGSSLARSTTRPKSPSLQMPSRPTKMFSGLTSMWMRLWS